VLQRIVRRAFFAVKKGLMKGRNIREIRASSPIRRPNHSGAIDNVFR